VGKPAAATHWLRENAQERSPYRVLVFDTETLLPDENDPDRQTLRLWAARLIRRKGVDPKAPRSETYHGITAAELAELVVSLARSDRTLWLVAHNLSFDLAVTELPVLLTEAGWRITEAALTTDDPWCRLAKGSRRLVIADSWSWFPSSVETIGSLMRRQKLTLPAWDASDDEWLARCRRDVDIVASAISSTLEWWDAGRFGNWSLTGPATGWSSYRHRRPAPHVLVDPDPTARAFEMAAVTGGRHEVRRLGQLRPGLYADLDIATAHLTAMAGFALPMRRLRRFRTLPLDSPALDSIAMDAMAWATVRTESPRYPWASGRGTLYPVGTFRTLLPGPELREARARGELVSIGTGYLYMVAPHMADWALWVGSLLDERNPTIPAAARLLAKHWSRCVPGKWAGHTSEVIDRSPDPRPGWAVERLVLMPERRQADLLRVGRERWTIVRDEWADDAFPAILAWIQSLTRVAVSRLIDVLGPAVVSVNTDGMLVDVAQVIDLHGDPELADVRASAPRLQELDRLCQAWDTITDPFSVRVKKAARRATIISPQHLILDQERRLAGIPRRAIELGKGRYAFTQWPRLRVQLAKPSGPGYRTVSAQVQLSHVPPGSWLLETGDTFPARVEPGPDGRDQVQPPVIPGWEAGELAAVELQHPALRPAYQVEPEAKPPDLVLVA
jgi:hypothetical protein